MLGQRIERHARPRRILDGLRVWIWLLSLSVLWGGSFFFAKSRSENPTLTRGVCTRGLVALVLDIVLLATRRSHFDAMRHGPTTPPLENNVLLFSLIFCGRRSRVGLASS